MSLGGAAEQHTPVLAPGDRFGLRHAALWLDRAIGMLTEGVGAVIVVAVELGLGPGLGPSRVFLGENKPA